MSITLKTMAAVVAMGMSGLIVRQATYTAGPLDREIRPVPGKAIAAQKLTAVVSKAASNESEADNFQRLQDLIHAARIASEAMPGYSANFEMQEEVNGILRAVDHINIRIRREPLSVFMRWANGQEALYVNGKNDNRLIVKPTAGLAAIRRIWRLDPTCRMAMRTSRYPITEMGVEMLAIRIQEFYLQHSDKSHLADCEHVESTFRGRDVSEVNIRFKDRILVPEYHSSKLCFDKQTRLLIAVDNYGWSESAEPRLIEHYHYEQIIEDPTLKDEDFTEENPAYKFVAR